MMAAGRVLTVVVLYFYLVPCGGVSWRAAALCSDFCSHSRGACAVHARCYLLDVGAPVVL